MKKEFITAGAALSMAKRNSNATLVNQLIYINQNIQRAAESGLLFTSYILSPGDKMIVAPILTVLEKQGYHINLAQDKDYSTLSISWSGAFNVA